MTEVAYPRQYIDQLSPSLLRLVAALNGCPPPAEDHFDYCELGCASADTLTTLAAANPGARFVGVDLSGPELALGSGRAERAGLSNVTLLERDFSALAGEELPPFDIIVAHGIWTWVSAAKRSAMLAFVQQRLKPGGLFYVSYNALPGWGAVEPLRRLMLDHTAGHRGSAIERAREGLAFAQRLCDSGTAYFGANPTAKSMLALMQKAGLPYVVHEYFNGDWQPMYFCDVARIVASYDLSFLGQLPLHLNVRDLAIPPSLKKTAESMSDRIVLEGLKDYATNELFRSDVYVKGKVGRSVSETRYYFEGTRFGTMTQGALVKREVKLPFYTLDYGGPVYGAILAAISERPATAMELALRPELATVGQLRIGDFLQNLVLGGQVVAMRADEAGDDGLCTAHLAYNRVVLADAVEGTGPLVFASPVTRAGVHLSLVEAICLHLVANVDPAGHAAWVQDFARRRSPLVLGDRKIKDGDELLRIVTRELERFREAALSRLRELGITL